ncbi:hypothetical protein EOL70_02335 [Leucothrix sargassi]|nr:hypothetical protein EOL70_02335 [Leucothrix sargassi]
MKLQPTKIILINSANCQYAEFDLTDSLHLVALNNRGKTSIINTLQFLYIDNFKEINFGYTLDETWKHYFPAVGSYILFELNTLTGKKVFGLSATGFGSQPEKFILDGEYDSRDFIDDSDGKLTPKKPDFLFPLFSQKLLGRQLESKHHRALLRPFNQKLNPSGLGLIGDTRDYRLFKRLFRQLLQLKGISIKDLKAQIEQVNHSVMEKEQRINVQREFSEPYERVRKEQDALRRLQDNQLTIENLIERTQQLKKRQGKLVSYQLKANSLFAHEDEVLNETLETCQEQQLRAKDKLPEIMLAKQDKQTVISQEDQRLGVINNDIARYEALTRECNDIVVELEQQKATNLEQELDQLQEQLFNVRHNDLSSLESSLAFKQEKLGKAQLQLKNLSSTLFVQLKATLTDEELTTLYKLSNTELWSLLNDKFEVEDAAALKAFLSQHLETNEQRFTLPGLSVDLSSISATGLQQLGNPEFLEKQIEKLTSESTELRQKIDAIREQASIQRRIDEIKQALATITAKLKKHADWQASEVEYHQWLEQSELIMSAVSQHKLEMNEFDEKSYDIRQNIKQFAENIKVTRQKIEVLTGQKRWIESHAPDSDWVETDVIYDTVTFEALYDEYRQQFEALADDRKVIAQSLEQLRTRFIHLTDLSDTDAIGFLQNQLEAIPEQEKSINDEWKRIFTSFASHCRGIIDSVDAIDSYLTNLNQLLSNQTISNLQSIKIVIGKNEWYRRVEKIKEWKDNDLPLFGGLDESSIDELMGSIKPLLDKVNITIADLYDLVLIVVDTHGKEKRYQSLDLESNGTSITVKTIIFISMLNQAISGKKKIGETIRLPFYVDEIDSLDDANAQNIHDIALKLGLIPIFASPKGSGICKRLYQLENNAVGKLMIHKKSGDTDKLVLVRPTFERVSVVPE